MSCYQFLDKGFLFQISGQTFHSQFCESKDRLHCWLRRTRSGDSQRVYQNAVPKTSSEFSFWIQRGSSQLGLVSWTEMVRCASPAHPSVAHGCCSFPSARLSCHCSSWSGWPGLSSWSCFITWHQGGHHSEGEGYLGSLSLSSVLFKPVSPWLLPSHRYVQLGYTINYHLLDALLEVFEGG